MKPICFLLALLVAAPMALAQPVPAAAPAVDAAEVSPAGPFAAAEIAWEAQLYATRPVVVFADSDSNPDYLRQLHLLERGLADLAERDVIVVLDTDPAAASEWRTRLRPRGFSVVVLDKDLRPVIRKPSPWDVREITRSIDRLPSRRQEMQERFPGR